jgi:class 3 adenylate cyclase
MGERLDLHSNPASPPPLTEAEVVALHPWPARWGDGTRLTYLWHFDLAASPADVWRITSDTSRMNRALGTAEMHFEERGPERWGWSRPGGVRHEWRELPWNWVGGEWLECVRVYQRGFMKVMQGVQRVTPLPDGGARFTAFFAFLPRGVLGAAAIRLGFPGLERTYRSVLAAIDRELQTVGALMPAALTLAPPALAPDAQLRLDRIRGELRGDARALDREAIDRLCDWIATADELDLHRIQVRERARRWGLDEDALLRVFLHATRAGLLQLSWDVVCPHCRDAEGTDRLGAVVSSASCPACAITFATDTAEAIEITFRVHPSIRAVAERHFCSAEPAHKEHIRVQRALAPGEAIEIAPALSPRRYRARLHGEERVGFLDVAAGGEPAIAWAASGGPITRTVSSAPTVRLENDLARETTFVIEDAQWSDVALRPGRLLSFQDFRDLFAEEYVGADVRLAVGEQTILFTDMIGSTALYADRGDPAAFVEVRRHFDALFALIAQHRGAVVKTIGDAAMAAFHDPLDAVRCSKAIHDRFSPACTDSVVRLRISLNTGPCIAVKLNANIDYFGSTVNVAAKLQAKAQSWQIAMATTTYAAPGVADWLAAQGATIEDDAYRSTALPMPVAVKRWTVYDEG